MEMKRLMRIILLSGIVLLVMIMAIPIALAANKGTNPVQLKINYIYVDSLKQSIFIHGINFTKAKNVPVVTVGGVNLEIYNNYTDTTIQAKFPGSGILDGDYLLTVTTGNGSTDYDEYNLTIGPQGSQGPKGNACATAGVVITVPSQFPTIQQAIDSAGPGDIITIAAGSYAETLKLKNKCLTIQGAGSASTWVKGIAGSDTLTIDQSNAVVVSGMTIEGGAFGIRALRGTVIELNDTVVQGAGKSGIRIDENSTARMTNVTTKGNSLDGIAVFRSSSVTFLGPVTTSSNGRDGVFIGDSSSALFSGATVVVSENSRYGIYVLVNAGLVSDSSTITIKNGKGTLTNLGAGIAAFGSSSIFLINNSSLINEDNSLDGIQVISASSFVLDPTSSFTIQRARRNGVILIGNSHLFLWGKAWVENNREYGMTLQSSMLDVAAGSLTINENANFGLRIGINSAVAVAAGSTLSVSGTTGSGIGINLDNKSTLGVSGSLFVQNNKGSRGIGLNVQAGCQAQISNAVIQGNNIGISVFDGSVYGDGSINIKGNTAKDVDIYFGSRVSLPNGSYDTIQCSQSLTTMNVLCP